MNQKVKLDKQIELVAEIHALSHDGRGIATIQNKTTFVSGALPQETVAFKIMRKHSHYNEANTVQIIHSSPARVKPPCQHFDICGGCSLQYMDMAMQIELKQKTLLDQLKHFGQVTPEILLPPLQANTLGYRRKARLGAKWVLKKNKMLVGFREKSSRYLADLKECVILHPTIGDRLLILADLISSLEIAQHIPQVEVAIGDTQTALIFRHMQTLSSEDKEKLILFGQQHAMQIYLQPNPPASVTKLWPTQEKERLSYTLPDYQLEFLFHPLDFTQINLEMNRLMVKQAMTLLDLKSHETVLDLFCGIGNFTLPIARYAKHVTGIEGGHEMVTRARDNAIHNDIHNVEFYAANLESPDNAASWMHKQYDKILLDPPRAGAKEIIPYFKQFAAKQIVYVSCNPATLARDAGELVHQYGYQLKLTGIMNMFPHTSHTEAMAVFVKND